MPSSGPLRLVFALLAAVAVGSCAWGTEVNGEAGAELFALLDANADGQLTEDEIPETHRRLFDRLIRRADVDSNGGLSAGEFAKDVTPTAPDKPMVEPTDGEFRGADALRLVLLRLDVDGDSRLTRSEAPAELRSVFNRLVSVADRNKDGEIDRTELTRAGPQLSRQAQQIVRRLGWDIEKEMRLIAAAQGADADRFERGFDPVRTLGNTKQATELFKQLDANHDGELVAAELPEPLQERVGRLIRRADRDGSGGASLREFLAQSERLSALLSRVQRSEDRDSGEPMTDQTAAREAPSKQMAESPERGQQARQFQRLVNRMDRDQDGAVSREEARGRLARRFERLDRNKNGRLDPPEIRTVVERLSRTERDAGAPRNGGADL